MWLQLEKIMEFSNFDFQGEGLERRPEGMITYCLRYQALAQPESVQNRSVLCDIEWPQYSDISHTERDFPLGENMIFSVSLRYNKAILKCYILFSLCHHEF